MISSRVKHNIQYGFTLIEVMISVAILSIGLVLILQGSTNLLNILRISENNLKVTLMAENKMAEAEISIKENRNIFLKDLNEEFQFDNVQLKWEVSITLDEENENLNKVEAVMFWQEGKRTGKIFLDTYMRNYAEAKQIK